MEPINYETPVDETNYTMRKQNYDSEIREKMLLAYMTRLLADSYVP